MLEIIALIVLVQKIGDMARRRGRSPSLFGLLLLVCWFGGQVAGAVIGYVLSGTGQADDPNRILVVYGGSLAGAVVGVGIAFLYARSFGPVDGVWRETSELPVSRSRLLGAVVGGVGGGVIGAVFVALMSSGSRVDRNQPLMIQVFIALCFIGTLFGMVSGIQKK